MKFVRKTVLYFLENGRLTAETEAAARELEFKQNVNIRFRNGSVAGTGAPEKADYIAGGPIPNDYAAFPVITAEGVVASGNDAPRGEELPQEKPGLTGLAAEIGSAGSGGWA